MNQVTKKIGTVLAKSEYLQYLYCAVTDREQVSGGSLIGARYIEAICTSPRTGFQQFKIHASKICEYFSNKVMGFEKDPSSLDDEVTRQIGTGAALGSRITKEIEEIGLMLPSRFTQSEMSNIYKSYYIFKQDTLQSQTKGE